MKYKDVIFVSLRALLILPVIALLNSCDSKNNSEKTVNEGIIEYDAKVVDFNHPLAELAPGSATLKFTEDKLEMEMTAMGMFKNTYICNLSNKTLTQMVNFLDVKQASIDDQQEINKENEAYKLIIEETPETKVIAGYNCKKLKVKKAAEPNKSFDVYYTDEMGSEAVNSLSPYAKIKGMLMQYRLSKMGLEMEFTAKSVKKTEVPAEAFLVPENFKIITKQEMRKFFEQF